MSSYPPFYAYPSAPPVVRAVPDPPRLHWGFVLVLSIATFGLFGMAWMIVQANWVRKVRGRSKALPWAIAYAAILPVLFLFAIVMGFVGALLHLPNVQGVIAIAILLARIALLALWLVSIYTLSRELSADPIDIPLSGVMVFFFGPIYFQYHLFDYQVPDAAQLFRGPLRTDLEAPPEPTRSKA